MKAMRAVAIGLLVSALAAAPVVAQTAAGKNDHQGGDKGDKPPPIPLPLPILTTTTTLVVTTTIVTTTTAPAPVVTTTTSTSPPPPPTTTLPGPPRCVPGTSLGCADGNPCTIDVCDATFHCVAVPAEGYRCDDGDPCTTGDHCQSGRCAGAPIDCSDGIACTADRCENGKCVHLPIDGRCDSGACEVAACRPGDPSADARGCAVVGRPVAAKGHDRAKDAKGAKDPKDDSPAGGRPGPSADAGCTDDGFSCTDDVCGPTGCQHVPIDSRCVPADECTSAVCAPESPDHDAAGCAPGPPRTEGEECAEDGDACTLDVCRSGSCTHEPVHDDVTCAPVQGAFRQSITLDAMTRSLMEDAAAAGGDVAARLAAVQSALSDAARALAGKDAPAPAVAAGSSQLAAIASTPAQQRAKIAFTMVLRTPRQVAAFLQTVALARTRAALGQPSARDLRRRGHLLLRGTKTLKADLKRLQKVTAALAR